MSNSRVMRVRREYLERKSLRGVSHWIARDGWPGNEWGAARNDVLAIAVREADRTVMQLLGA
jgi:hypothetical protein